MSDSSDNFSKDRDTYTLLNLLKAKEDEVRALRSEISLLRNSSPVNGSDLTSSEIERYSRQILIPEFGIRGQASLKRTSVLVVGAGGLGCPAATYLAAAGVGTIGVVDYDKVEITNLHRQVCHNETSLGLSKCISLVNSLRSLNSLIKYEPYNFQLNSKNAKDVIDKYDIVVDASDNAPTRYLLNDACVLLNKPLVSGSALRLEGHLTVYNFEDSPCYRCLYPSPPTSSTVTNCSDAGVLGPVTGMIGSLQALEVIKIATGMSPTFKNKLLVFDGECARFRVFNLRGKNPSCLICGESPTIKELIDYEVFCQTSAVDKCMNICLLPDSDRITCAEYKKTLEDGASHILIDVRPPYEFDICSLPNSINIPINEMTSNQGNRLMNVIKESKTNLVYVVCRRGNDSQKAVQLIRTNLPDLNVSCYDIKGGLQAWHHEVDNNFPLY